jgi:hypothetical protein
MSDSKRVLIGLAIFIICGFCMWATDEPEAMKDMSVAASRAK